MVHMRMPGNVPLWGARSRTAFPSTQWFGVNTAPHTIAPINHPGDYAARTREPGRTDWFGRAGFDNEGVGDAIGAVVTSGVASVGLWVTRIRTIARINPGCRTEGLELMCRAE
jgi:hypothetical protein